MVMRTFKVQGWGTGTAKITASLDDDIVFSGDVSLVEFANEVSRYNTAPTLFTFNLPLEFAGQKRIKITVAGAPVRFGQIVSNYTRMPWGDVLAGDAAFSGPNEFVDGTEPDEDGTLDPRTNVKIDGIEQTPDRGVAQGTWHWFVNPGSTFEHVLTVQAGSEDEF